MEKTELKDAFAEFKNLKNIDRPTMMGVLEDVFKTALPTISTSSSTSTRVTAKSTGTARWWRMSRIRIRRSHWLR